MSLTLGKTAPSFSGMSTQGIKLSLKDFKGQWLILYFYPKDNTPGCTQEGQDFTAKIKAFEKCGATIIGVSRDSVACHLKFHQKYAFAFDLIADEDEKICQAYDVIKEKNLYGKKSWGIERSTFLIDPAGKLTHEWRKVRVAGHVDEVLKTLHALQSI